MAFAITGLVASGIRIGDPGCVSKTFPGYFRGVGIFTVKRRGFRLYFLGPWEAFS